MNIGIVGHEAAKFTSATEAQARAIIRALLIPGSTVVSGRCHLGGVDIFAEEEADRLGIPKLIFPPKNLSWATGYKLRNLQIAQSSDIVHCIVVAAYPPDYAGMRFDFCYHDKRSDHIKSGGCWTALRCGQRQWHIILADGEVRTFSDEHGSALRGQEKVNGPQEKYNRQTQKVVVKRGPARAIPLPIVAAAEGQAPSYRFRDPWPESLPAGDRTIGPFTACAGCKAGTWVSYGGVPYCLGCAKHDIES